MRWPQDSGAGGRAIWMGAGWSVFLSAIHYFNANQNLIHSEYYPVSSCAHLIITRVTVRFRGPEQQNSKGNKP